MRTICLLATIQVAIFSAQALAQDSVDKPAADDHRPAATKPAERPDLSPAQARDLAATLRINELLDQDTRIEAKEAEFVDVVRMISKQHKLPIVLDPEGLETAGVTADQLVNLKLDDVSLRNALRALLKPLHLGFVVRHEVLTITSLDCPERMATVRTFPLGDLVKRMDDPSELISALETIWPDEELVVSTERQCKPRARILAGHLVVRGSPRHLDLAEQLIDGLMAERPAPEVKAIISLPATSKPVPYDSLKPMPDKKPKPVRPMPEDGAKP
jgi:hypothetical protein